MLRKMSDAEATQPIHRLDARRGPGKRCSLLCPGPRHSTPAELPTGGWSFRLLSCRSSNGSGGKWSRPLGAWGRGRPGPRRNYLHAQFITPFASKLHVGVHYPHNPQLQPHSRLNRPAAAGSFERFSGALGAETWGACREPRGPAFTPHCAQANGGPWDHYSLSTQVVAICTAGAEDHMLTLRQLRSSVVEAARGEAPPERIEPE